MIEPDEVAIQALSFYDTFHRAVEGELKDLLANRQGFLYGLLRYHLGWVDQRGQPANNVAPLGFPAALALAAAQAVAGGPHAALPVAAAAELVCQFTGVHADVQAGRVDAQERPSIWWVYGPAQAINAGDGLHALARLAIMRLGQRGLPPEQALYALRTLDKACLSLCEGQYLDLSFQDQLMVTAASYFDMIGRKAGALAGAAAELGALAAGLPQADAAKFRMAGHDLGLAWQIRQDIADFWGRGGGVTANNILSKKKGLPLVCALETASVAVKRELGAIYMKRVLEPSDISRIVAALEAANARQQAEAKAAEFVEQASQELAPLGLSPQRLGAWDELVRWMARG